MSLVADLEPKSVWRHFNEILKIPRGSKKEDRIRDYVIRAAEQNGLSYEVDSVGNLVVRKPATPGHESAPITVLQSHLDMVTEKNSEVEHDFDRDPIVPRREGDYITASGTTLGADNGIGVATMLAIIEAKDIVHGPLELLFTVDEETGLTGAAGLAPDLLEGRRLINLDSEEEGTLYVGCAGGADSNLTLPLRSQPLPAQHVVLDLHLAGLRGGHSGVDIHLQRGNATKLLARALYAVSLQTPFFLVDFHGGNKHNAIPREAFATVALPADQRQSFISSLNAEIEAIQDEFRPADPNIALQTSTADPVEQCWNRETTDLVLRLITALPHGVLSMSYDIPDLVETSTNLATVNVTDGKIVIGMSSRSSVASALRALRQRIRAIASLAGASVEEGAGYPGWKPNLNSPILAVTKQAHEKVLGSQPAVKAIHAGLECGIIGEKFPGMDMVSIGPQIEFPHSPDERVKISSVDRFFKVLLATLEDLA